MGDEGDIWREHKEYMRQKKEKYQESISGLFTALVNHPLCIEVGDHHRLDGQWDFWYTGTVFNIKTKRNTSITKLSKMYLIEK